MFKLLGEQISFKYKPCGYISEKTKEKLTLIGHSHDFSKIYFCEKNEKNFVFNLKQIIENYKKRDIVFDGNLIPSDLNFLDQFIITEYDLSDMLLTNITALNDIQKIFLNIKNQNLKKEIEYLKLNLVKLEKQYAYNTQKISEIKNS